MSKKQHCAIANQGCQNPAAIRAGSGIGVLPPRTTWECPECGNPACKACRRAIKGREVCDYCADNALSAPAPKPAPERVAMVARKAQEAIPAEIAAIKAKVAALRRSAHAKNAYATRMEMRARKLYGDAYEGS